MLHTRIALKMTGLLLAAGTLAMLALEWKHSLAGMGAGERLWAAFFQAMTPRTAGFNTVDIGALFSSTLLVIMLMMIVGGSPGSTAGGIKTTTLAILLGLVRSQALGRARVELRERAIPEQDVARALATIALYTVTMIAGIGLLLVSESWGRPAGEGQGRFLELSFETISALSTVGLSMGATAGLSTSGKLVIVLMMLCGRLGPIAVVAALVGRARGGRYEYAEESVLTG
jgi:trk system potassium uptake protein TrkH